MPRKLTHFKNYFDKEFKTNKFLEHINFMILYLGELIYLYINDMSNILRSKQGNLSKIKYLSYKRNCFQEGLVFVVSRMVDCIVSGQFHIFIFYLTMAMLVKKKLRE